MTYDAPTTYRTLRDVTCNWCGYELFDLAPRAREVTIAERLNGNGDCRLKAECPSCRNTALFVVENWE